jgi:hypothetical protein
MNLSRLTPCARPNSGIDAFLNSLRKHTPVVQEPFTNAHFVLTDSFPNLDWSRPGIDQQIISMLETPADLAVIQAFLDAHDMEGEVSDPDMGKALDAADWLHQLLKLQDIFEAEEYSTGK